MLSVDEIKSLIGTRLASNLLDWAKDVEAEAKKAWLAITFQTRQVVQRQRGETASLKKSQNKRWLEEENAG